MQPIDGTSGPRGQGDPQGTQKATPQPARPAGPRPSTGQSRNSRSEPRVVTHQSPSRDQRPSEAQR